MDSGPSVRCRSFVSSRSISITLGRVEVDRGISIERRGTGARRKYGAHKGSEMRRRRREREGSGGKKSARKNGITRSARWRESVSGVKPTALWSRKNSGVFDDPRHPRGISFNYVTALVARIRKHGISILSMHNKTFIGSDDAPSWPSQTGGYWESRLLWHARVNMPFCLLQQLQWLQVVNPFSR